MSEKRLSAPEMDSESALDQLMSILSLPKQGVDALARAGITGPGRSQGLGADSNYKIPDPPPISPDANVGQMLRSGVGLSQGGPGMLSHLAGKGIEIAGNAGLDPLTWSGLGLSGKVGALANQALLLQSGRGASQAVKGVYDQYKREGFTPAVAESGLDAAGQALMFGAAAKARGKAPTAPNGGSRVELYGGIGVPPSTMDRRDFGIDKAGYKAYQKAKETIRLSSDTSGKFLDFAEIENHPADSWHELVSKEERLRAEKLSLKLDSHAEAMDDPDLGRRLKADRVEPLTREFKALQEKARTAYYTQYAEAQATIADTHSRLASSSPPPERLELQGGIGPPTTKFKEPLADVMARIRAKAKGAEVKPSGAKPSEGAAHEQTVLAAIRELSPATHMGPAGAAPIYMPKLFERSGLSKEAFDTAIKNLSEREEVQTQAHPVPSQLKPEEKAAMVVRTKREFYDRSVASGKMTQAAADQALDLQRSLGVDVDRPDYHISVALRDPGLANTANRKIQAQKYIRDNSK